MDKSNENINENIGEVTMNNSYFKDVVDTFNELTALLYKIDSKSRGSKKAGLEFRKKITELKKDITNIKKTTIEYLK